MSFMQVLKVLGCILPVAALCIASAKLNLSKVNRSRQFPMPIISLIYGIVMLFLFGKVETVVHFLHKIFTLLANWLELVCYNFPFAFFTQLFFIQPLIRTVFKALFAKKKAA